MDEEGWVNGTDQAPFDRDFEAPHRRYVNRVDEEFEIGLAADGIKELPLEKACEREIRGIEAVYLVDEERDTIPREGSGEKFALNFGDLAQRALEDGFVQRVLGRKVIDDGRLVSPGAVRNFLDGDAAEAAIGEEFGGDIEDGLAPIIRTPTLTNRSGNCYHMVSIGPPGGAVNGHFFSARRSDPKAHRDGPHAGLSSLLTYRCTLSPALEPAAAGPAYNPS